MPRLPKVFRRAGGWYGRLQRGGKDRWIPLGSDEKEAERKWERLRADDAVLPGPRVTVAEAARRWLASRKGRRSERNHKMAEVRVKRYLSEHFKHMRLDRVKKSDLWEYRQRLEEKTLSVQTVAAILSDARCFFRWCADRDMIDVPPVPSGLVPRPPKTLPRWLTDEEVEALLRMDEPWRFIIRLWLATGLRWGEICKLEARHLTPDGWLEVEQPKTGKVVRIPLMETDPALVQEIRGRVGKLLHYGPKSVPTFNRTVRARSGLARFSSHSLRHTFATRWLRHGGNIVALQEILGHSDIRLTQRYARTTADFIRAEARRQAMHAEAARATEARSVAGSSSTVQEMRSSREGRG